MTPDYPPPKKIAILPEPDGVTVAYLIELGKVAGKFTQSLHGQIHFLYRWNDTRVWYVNKDMDAFRKAAAIFNHFCETGDDDSDDAAVWASISTELRSAFEQIEPIGAPELSLWSATIHDTEGGLLTLF